MALEVLPARLGDGLNLVDAPETLEQGAARVLTNWRFSGVGRLTPRKALGAGTTISGKTIIGIFPYVAANVGGVVITHSASTDTVELYTVDGDGESPTLIGALAGWPTTIADPPQVLAATLNRVLFIADTEGQYGLTVWDPNDVMGTGTDLYQPLFNFYVDGADTPAAQKLYCKGVESHSNMLFVWGYGSEATGDTERPEMLRWSYLGMTNDGAGSGDAGYKDDGTTVTLARSQDLFDREDAAMVGERGVDIVAVKSASNSRAVVLKEDAAFVLYGTDRDTFQLDLLDSERGCVNARAVCEANGMVYWWSPLGPCRYTGNQIEDLSRVIKPRLAAIDKDMIFALHVPDANEVRFYHRRTTDTGTLATRALVFDYRMNQWLEHELGVSVFSAGRVETSGLEGPIAAPSALSITNLDSTSATLNWTNGDTTPAVVTTIQRAPDVAGSPGTYVDVGTVNPGIASFGVVGLSASTTYWVRVKHTRNGTDATSSGTSFTTNSAASVAAPKSFTATDTSYFDPSKGISELRVTLSWSAPPSGTTTYIERRSPSGSGSYSVIASGVGGTSYDDTDVVSETNYGYRARHLKDGTYSAYTSEKSVTPVDPYS